MKTSLRKRAALLRRNGWSYNDIRERLGVSKGTLSSWLRDIPYEPNSEVRKRIREGPARSAIVTSGRRVAAIRTAKIDAAQELGYVTRRDLWMLGIGLYIGEGSKLYENVCVINAEPAVIKLAMKWFREVCKLSSENFTIKVHLYPDTPQKEALRFWAKITGIPLSQFGKTQIDERKNKSRIKHRRLPFGTAHIRIRSAGEKKFGVALHRRILGWIEAVYASMDNERV